MSPRSHRRRSPPADPGQLASRAVGPDRCGEAVEDEQGSAELVGGLPLLLESAADGSEREQRPALLERPSARSDSQGLLEERFGGRVVAPPCRDRRPRPERHGDGPAGSHAAGIGLGQHGQAIGLLEPAHGRERLRPIRHLRRRLVESQRDDPLDGGLQPAPRRCRIATR